MSRGNDDETLPAEHRYLYSEVMAALRKHTRHFTDLRQREEWTRDFFRDDTIMRTPADTVRAKVAHVLKEAWGIEL